MADTPRPPYALTVLPPRARPEEPQEPPPSRFAIEVLEPSVPRAVGTAAVLRDLTSSVSDSMDQSPRRAARFAKTSGFVAEGWKHFAEATESMAIARNAAALCAKTGAQFAAETTIILADATLHRAKVHDEIGTLVDTAAVREATRSERITDHIERMRIDRQREALRLRNDEAEGALARQRAVIEMRDLERSSRVRQQQALGEIRNGTFQRAYDTYRGPISPSAPTSEDEIGKFIDGMGTYSARKELNEFFRPALGGAVHCHVLAPCVSFVFRSETELKQTPTGEAIRLAARTALSFLELPRERWANTVADYYMEELRKLDATLAARHDEETRARVNRENDAFFGVEGMGTPNF